jgi:hypothetical protein
MAKKDLELTPAQHAEKRKKKSAKKRKKAGRPNAKPLPAPVPVAAVEVQSRPGNQMNLDGIFPQSGAGSELPSDPSLNLSEPKPGEELSPEAEALLSEIDDGGGDAQAAPGAPASADSAVLGAMLPDIAFEEEDVRAVLEESFAWLAEKFDSGHWNLTERQSRMLGKPTAELLSGLYMRVREFLPDILLHWCDATPGLMGVLIAGTIVVVPKVKTQVSLSMQKRHQPKRVTAMPARPSPAQPGPISSQPVHVGPVGVAQPGAPM